MTAPVIQFKRGAFANLPGLQVGEPALTTDTFELYVGIDSTTEGNKFFGSHRYWSRETSSTGSGVNFVEGTSNGSQFVTLKAPNSLSGITTFTLPSADGSPNQALITDGSGNLTFTTVASDAANLAGAGTGVTTFLVTPSSANLKSAVTDETGSGSLVFANGPTLVSPILGNANATTINVSGVATVGSLVCNDGSLFTGSVQINNNLNINGNITLGGTSIYHASDNVVIKDKDIVLGVTTDTSLYPDTSTDNTANHGGIAIASTEGSPLISLQAVGVNSLPDTYKQFMWIKSGTFAGLGTDVWLSNYAIGIGSTQVPNGVRLAVGGVQITDNTITATTGSFTTLTGSLTGTATTATRANTVDTTGTTSNADYFVPFVDGPITGQNGETVRVGAGLSVNPSTGDVKASGSLSVGNINAVNAFIKAGGGSNAMYLYSNGDVSFQAKVIASEIRSQNDSNTLITLSGLDATFAQNVRIVGVTTVGTLKLSGTSGIGITGISASTTLAENSDVYIPTQKAVKAYVDAVDLTLGLNADSGGPSTVNTSQTLTISGTTNEVETSVSGQTVTVGLPNSVTITTALTTPTVKATNLQANDGTTAITITNTTGAVATNNDLTVGGNLYVNGSTTQVNTSSLTVEDRTIELGIVDGAAPSSTTTWDLGVLFNYNDGTAKKSALVWEQGDARFKLASAVSDSGGTGTTNPQITFATYAPLEIGGLWVNDCAGQSQVISCTGSTRKLENITIDAGTF